jgi:hypothetical protein
MFNKLIAATKEIVKRSTDPVEKLCDAVDVIRVSKAYRDNKYELQTEKERAQDEKALSTIFKLTDKAFSNDPEKTLSSLCSLSPLCWSTRLFNDKIETLLDQYEKTNPAFVCKTREEWLTNASRSPWYEYGNLTKDCVKRQTSAIARQRLELAQLKP